MVSTAAYSSWIKGAECGDVLSKVSCSVASKVESKDWLSDLGHTFKHRDQLYLLWLNGL